jgi:hypothetical protein
MIAFGFGKVQRTFARARFRSSRLLGQLSKYLASFFGALRFASFSDTIALACVGRRKDPPAQGMHINFQGRRGIA